MCIYFLHLRYRRSFNKIGVGWSHHEAKMEKMFSYIRIQALKPKVLKVEWLNGEEMNGVLFCIMMTQAELYELCSDSANPN